MKKIFCAVAVFAVTLHIVSGNVQAAEKEKVSAPAVIKVVPVADPAPVMAKPVPVVIPGPAVVPSAPAPATPVAPAEKKEISREDMVARVKEMCQYHPDMLPAIPGLVMKEADGKKTYEFNGKKLDDLDKETVTNLFREVNRFISFKNTQRFQQQMKSMKQKLIFIVT